MGNKKHVADFLLKLSQDQQFKDDYQADPDAVMDAAGLDQEDKDVIKTGDVDKVRAHLGEDDPPGCVFIIGLLVF